MQIVIDISEKAYNEIMKDTITMSLDTQISVINAIQDGAPLPKGHGRLVDADAILEDPYGNTYKDINIAETIIEADKEVDL